MDYQEILLKVKLLSHSDQTRLISDILGRAEEDYLSFRRQQLYDRQAPVHGAEGKNIVKTAKTNAAGDSNVENALVPLPSIQGHGWTDCTRNRW